MSPLCNARQVMAASLLAVVAGLASTGCSPTSARAGVGLPPAFIYKNYKVPLTVAPPAEGGRPAGAVGRFGSVGEGGPASGARPEGGPPPGAGGPPADAPKGIVFPEGMKMVKVRTYMISPLNIPRVPGGGIFSVGWGDMSERKWLEQGGMERFVYADAAELEILRVFNQVTIYAWGLPEDIAATGDAAQGPPPGVVGEQLGASAPPSGS